MAAVIIIIVLSVIFIVVWLSVFPQGVSRKIAETQIKEKTEATSELMRRAKELCDSREKILRKYKDDVEYKKLETALNALPTAYNRWAQEILSSPMVGKKPINPFVAAGIGDGIAGLGGAVVMGVAAQNENNKYEERLALFNSQLAKINSAGDKVAFLVDEIDAIMSRGSDETTSDDGEISFNIILPEGTLISYMIDDDNGNLDTDYRTVGKGGERHTVISLEKSGETIIANTDKNECFDISILSLLDLSLKYADVLKKYYVKVGDTVDAGDLIVECDNQSLVAPVAGQIVYLEGNGSQNKRKIRMGETIAQIKQLGI